MTTVDLWADIRCPWCWIGSRRLSRVSSRVAGRGEPIQIRHRSFLLEPQGPASPGLATKQVATSEWGMTPAQWEATRHRISTEARSENLSINVDEALMFDSSPAHRLLKFAETIATIDIHAAWDSAYTAHFERNANMGDAKVLRALASTWGLGAEEIDHALSNKRYKLEVARDLEEAHRLSIRSVPTIIAVDGNKISAVAPEQDLFQFLTLAGEAQ